MRNFTLWRCWPQKPGKAWELLCTYWASSQEEAYLYFKVNNWMNVYEDWSYIITF